MRTAAPSLSIVATPCDIGPLYVSSSAVPPDRPWVPDACGCLGFTYSKGYRIRGIVETSDALIVNIDSFKASGLVRVPFSPYGRVMESRMTCIVGTGELFTREGTEIYFQERRRGLLRVSENLKTERIRSPSGHEISASCVAPLGGVPTLFVLSEDEGCRQEISWGLGYAPRTHQLTRRVTSIEAAGGHIWAYSTRECRVEVYEPGEEELTLLASTVIGREKDWLYLRVIEGRVQAHYGPFGAAAELHEGEKSDKKELKSCILTLE